VTFDQCVALQRSFGRHRGCDDLLGGICDSPARSRTFGLLPHGTVCASSTDGGDLVRALTLNKEPHE
jgi:hypothetical protein